MTRRKGMLFAFIGFAVAASCALAFIINANKSVSYSDGTWNGTGDGRNGPIEISVTIENGKIVCADILSESETDFAKPAIRAVLDQAVAKGLMNSFDAVSGATISSKATFDAVRNALNEASGKTGSEEEIKQMRYANGIVAAYKMVDTCAAEFAAETPYYYSVYGSENEAVETNPQKKVLVLGSGPIR